MVTENECKAAFTALLNRIAGSERTRWLDVPFSDLAYRLSCEVSAVVRLQPPGSVQFCDNNAPLDDYGEKPHWEICGGETYWGFGEYLCPRWELTYQTPNIELDLAISALSVAFEWDPVTDPFVAGLRAAKKDVLVPLIPMVEERGWEW